LCNSNVRKQAINDKLQGSVAGYFRGGGVVNKQTKKGLLLESVTNFFFKIDEYLAQLQASIVGCLVHFVRLANTLLKEEESADNHVLASNFAKYSPILFFR